jgi:hypothetical protein
MYKMPLAGVAIWPSPRSLSHKAAGNHTTSNPNPMMLASPPPCRHCSIRFALMNGHGPLGLLHCSSSPCFDVSNRTGLPNPPTFAPSPRERMITPACAVRATSTISILKKRRRGEVSPLWTVMSAWLALPHARSSNASSTLLLHPSVVLATSNRRCLG